MMAHKYGHITIQQRVEKILNILRVVPAASVSALAKREACSESTIRNALNYMLACEQVTRRKENPDEVKRRITSMRKFSYMSNQIARPQWMYSIVKAYENVQLELIPRTINDTLIPDESGLTEHP